MEISVENDKGTQQIRSKKGGFRTMPFIISNETFEKVANVGLHVNMIIYLMTEYNYDAATGSIIIFLWNALTNFMPMFGAFLSDSYLGRFRVIMCGTLFELLGMIVLWLTAIIRNARPPHCNFYTEACAGPSTGQVLFLVSSLVLMAIGAGGIRPCSLAFAADQMNNPENLNNERIMKSFFNWYYVSVGVSIAVSVTVIVYVQIKTGWVVGFGITVGLMLFSTSMFFLGSPLYVKTKPEKSLLTGLVQAVVAAWKNRHATLPPKGSGDWYFLEGAKLVEPTEKLRFLNKACIIKNRVKDLDSNGTPINPWNLCTVRQVEELKVLIKVIPIWSTGFLVSIIINQYTFLVVQAGTMNRHLIFNFEIPAPNIAVFSIISMTIWITIYDRVLVPLLSKSKHPRIRGGFTLKQRMGIGLFLTVLATAVASQVERKRRSLAIEEGLVGNPKGVVNMSVWWLVPQLCITGLAEGFNIIAQIEFFYSQFPKSMSSVAVSFFYAGWGIGNVLGSVIVKTVKNLTQKGGRHNWLESSPNNGHYDYYYALLTILGVINLLCFFVCSWTYGTTQDIGNWDDEFDSNLQSKKEVDPRKN
ncbi:protein NRT1/ PTR FAMILY 1.1-like [Neltuma alba]|uniref:protein NRT1/ PTR FAMILY 1.1-like n=1 Tax=Neltuma alba TaxID=207710 RepID=UPI0010A4F68E|nr:protein NRT1/ PTR FAMILY 1.1-like [Prosopis alba]